MSKARRSLGPVARVVFHPAFALFLVPALLIWIRAEAGVPWPAPKAWLPERIDRMFGLTGWGTTHPAMFGGFYVKQGLRGDELVVASGHGPVDRSFSTNHTLRDPASIAVAASSHMFYTHGYADWFGIVRITKVQHLSQEYKVFVRDRILLDADWLIDQIRIHHDFTVAQGWTVRHEWDTSGPMPTLEFQFRHVRYFWKNILLDSLFVVGLTWALACVARTPIVLIRRNRMWRFRRGLCPTCTYDVSGTDATICPECGQGIWP